MWSSNPPELWKAPPQAPSFLLLLLHLWLPWSSGRLSTLRN
jgi:hypothetical protein